MLTERGKTSPIGVDGGIYPDTARQCIEAGATVLVGGTAIFGAPDYSTAIAGLRDAGSKNGGPRSGGAA